MKCIDMHLEKVACVSRSLHRYSGVKVHSTFLSSSWNIREVVGPPNRLLNESVAFPISKVADNIPYMFNLEGPEAPGATMQTFRIFFEANRFFVSNATRAGW